VDRPVLLATALLGCITLTHPAYTFFLPLYAQYRGIENVGWYFAANGVAGVMAYGFVGTQSDRLGRGAAIGIGFAFGLVGLFLMMIASSFWVLIVAGIIYSIGQAVAIPNTMALAIDRAHPQRRGAAMGTYTLAYTSGQGIGAAISGGLIEFVGYEAMYAVAIAAMATGLVLTARNWPALRKGAPSPYATS
jgi:MFS family permease